MIMIDDYELKHATVRCTNDETCGYIGDFEDFLDDDQSIDADEMGTVCSEPTEWRCTCPKCGRKMIVELSPYMDFYVDERDSEN